MVIPSEGVAGWTSNSPPKAPLPESPPVAKTTAPSPSRKTGSDETKPTYAMADGTDPSTAVKDRSPAPAPAPLPPPTPADSEPDEPLEIADLGLIVALSSVALLGVAAIATLFPFGRIISGAIALVGFVGGICSLGAEGRAKIAAGAAIGLHFIFLSVVLLAPSWFNLDPWRNPEIDNAPPAPVALIHADQKIKLVEWVDSASASWQFKDVRVTVRSATLGPIDLIGPQDAKRLSKENYLVLVVRIANIGVERPLDLSGWAVGQGIETVQTDSAGRTDKPVVQLTDSMGRSVRPPAFEEGWTADLPNTKPIEKLFPGKSTEVRLLFSSPQSRIDFLKLSLPGTTFGFKEEVKFQIASGSIIQLAPAKK